MNQTHVPSVHNALIYPGFLRRKRPYGVNGEDVGSHLSHLAIEATNLFDLLTSQAYVNSNL